MELCLFTDSVGHLSTEQALDLAAEIGLTAVEIAAGGQSAAPHMQIADLLTNPQTLAQYRNALDTRGLRLAAINSSAWPMHPRQGRDHRQLIRNAIRLAHELEVPKIVSMSGTPSDSSAQAANWITFPWPAQNEHDSTSGELSRQLGRQWSLVIDFWQEMASYASDMGIHRIAIELHPVHLVYNTPTLKRLRAAAGPVIGANVDPSHMFWQQMDPIAVIDALGPAVHHVHLKDLKFQNQQLAVTGVLDLEPFEQPERRAWNFTTVGSGHGPDFWSQFLLALDRNGYRDVLSIEHEDPFEGSETGVRKATTFIRQLMAGPASR